MGLHWEKSKVSAKWVFIRKLSP